MVYFGGMRPARNVDEIIGRMHDKVVLRLGGYGVHFEDREHEVREFLNNVLKLERVAFIYGPFGAGKTTFLKTIAEAMEGGDTMFVYYDYNPAIIRESMPEIMAYVGYGVKNAVLEALKSIEVGMPISAAGFTLSMNLGKVIDVIIDVLRRHGGELGRIENVVFVIDEYDRYLREKLRDFEYHDISGVAGGFAQCVEHRDAMEHTFRDLAQKRLYFIFALSDQAALDVADKLGGKGHSTPYLFWNLPRRSFENILNEVLRHVRANVDVELLWQLLGGNMRELDELVNNYDWDVAMWLRENAINRIKNTFDNYCKAGRCGSISKVLNELIENGNSAARELNLGEFVGQPDIVRGYFGLLEGNVMVRLLGAWRLSGMSDVQGEPWFGNDYAYQIPAYYWALRAMIERRTVNVSPDDVVRTIRENAKTMP